MGLLFLIVLGFGLSFGLPIFFLIRGMIKLKTNRNAGILLLILGTVWLIIGGGTCLSLIMSV